MNLINEFKKINKWINQCFLLTISLYSFIIEINESTLMYLNIVKSTTSILFKLVFLMIFLISLYRFMTLSYSIKQLIILFLLFVLLAISYYYSRHSLFIFTFFCVFASKGVDINKIIKYIFISLIIAYLVIILSRIIGVSEEEITVAIRYGVGRNRYAFGFKFTCIGTIYFLFISLMYVYIKNTRISFIGILTLTLINILLFVLTDTKNNFLFVFLTIIIALIIKNNNKLINKVIGWIGIISPTSSFLLIATLTFLYSKKYNFAIKINSLLNGRLNLTYEAIKSYGINVFGNKVQFLGGNTKVGYNYVDPAYMQYLIQDGIIVLAITLVFLTYLIYKLYKQNNIWAVSILLLICTHAAFDDRLISVVLNPFIFLIFNTNYFLESKSDKINIKK